MTSRQKKQVVAALGIIALGVLLGLAIRQRLDHSQLLRNTGANGITQPQEIFANGEIYPNICADIYGVKGHSLTVTFKPFKKKGYGSFSPSTLTFTSTGYNKACTTYKAPDKDSAAGRYEQIRVGVHDNIVGLYGWPSSSVPFPILAPPPRP